MKIKPVHAVIAVVATVIAMRVAQVVIDRSLVDESCFIRLSASQLGVACVGVLGIAGSASLSGVSPRAVLVRPARAWLLLSACVGTACAVISVATVTCAGWAVEMLHPGVIEQWLKDSNGGTCEPSQSLSAWLGSALGILVVAPVIEEVLFRATLVDALRQVMSSRAATVSAAAGFAVAHLDPVGNFIFAMVFASARAASFRALSCTSSPTEYPGSGCGCPGTWPIRRIRRSFSDVLVRSLLPAASWQRGCHG